MPKLQVGLQMVCSASGSSSPSAALLRLHGATSACLRIVLGPRFSSLANSIETMSIFSKVDHFDEGFLLESSKAPVEASPAQAHHRRRDSATASRASTSAATPTAWADEDPSQTVEGEEEVRTVDPDLVCPLLLVSKPR